MSHALPEGTIRVNEGCADLWCQVEKLTAEELEIAIGERDRPLIVDFYATWCGPCVLMARELEKVAKAMGDKVRIVKVDTDENPQLSSQLKV